LTNWRNPAAVALSALLALGAALPAAPQAEAPSRAGGHIARIAIQQITLKNGLRVVLSEDHSAPTLSLCVTYDVGSRNEPAGRTGFAHLFEHLMFEGSQNVGKGEHMILVLNNGGDMNGSTSEDSTNYYESVPSNQLDLVLFLEADRMHALNVTQSNLDNQRNAVQEERRLRMDNQPYGKTDEVLDDLAYDNFAYKHSTMGSMADLNAASLEYVAGFYKTYYAPNNAVLSLVGDFKTADALAKIRQYFEAIPSQPAPPPVDMTEPDQKAERRVTIDDPFARLLRLDIAYKGVAANTPDWYALDMLGDLLFSGQSSRLYRKLVKDQAVALQVGGGISYQRGPGLFRAVAVLKPGEDPAEVEKMIYDEFENVKTSGVTAAELDKVRMQDRREEAQGLASTLNRARSLGRDAVYFRDPNLINTELDKYDTVTPADVQRVAKQYLIVPHRTVVLTIPQARTQPGAAAPANPGARP
jgi:zinc protease